MLPETSPLIFLAGAHSSSERGATDKGGDIVRLAYGGLLSRRCVTTLTVLFLWLQRLASSAATEWNDWTVLVSLGW